MTTATEDLMTAALSFRPEQGISLQRWSPLHPDRIRLQPLGTVLGVLASHFSAYLNVVSASGDRVMVIDSKILSISRQLSDALESRVMCLDPLDRCGLSTACRPA